MVPTLVAIVGADGTGKTTVSAQLVKQLNALGYPTRHIARWGIVDNPEYPSASFLEHDIPHIRKCVADMPMHARYLFLLWSISLALTGSKTGGPLDEILVMDGYWMKHAASEVAHGLTEKWVLGVSSALQIPEIVLHLSLTPEHAWARKGADIVPYECGMDPSCSRESFVKHQRTIARMLDKWSDSYGWTHIDASADLQDVVAIAIAHILANLSSHDV